MERPTNPGLPIEAGKTASPRTSFLPVEGSRIPSGKPQIPDHELLRLIGRGSYGEVWLARNAVGTFRAVKVVYRTAFDRDRPYEREFTGIQKFEPVSRSHEGVVDILQIGRKEGDGYFYYVMELADDLGGGSSFEPRGSSLDNAPWAIAPVKPETYAPRTLRRDTEQSSRLPLRDCIELGRAIASALAHLHKHGLVHRDVKPSNIISVGGKPKLADIGLVAEMSEARSFVGTDGFIPPEGPGAPSADLYSLGKVLYELSTGLDRQDFPRLPPDLKSSPERLGLSELNEIILKACADHPKDRYATAKEMLADLDLLRDGRSVKRERARQLSWAICKKASLGIALLTLTMTALVLFPHTKLVGDIQSLNPEVNTLVAQGNHLILNGTPQSLEAALPFFNKATSLEPGYAPADVGVFSVRVRQQLSVGNHGPEFERNLREAAAKLISLHPKLAEARVAQAAIDELNGRDREALNDAASATHLPSSSKEGSSLVHWFYGRQLIGFGRMDEAAHEFELAEEFCPSEPFVTMSRGHAYLARKDFPTALKYYQRAIDYEDRFGGAHFWANRVYEEMKDFPHAIQELEQSDRLFGQYKGPAFYLELLERFQREGPNGYWERRLQQAQSESPPDLYKIPAILAHLGRTKEAYTYLEQACRKGVYWLGDSLMDPCWNRNDEGFREAARKTWEAKYPETRGR